MADVSYEKLWIKMRELGMKKTDLIKAAGITSNSMARLGKGQDVRLFVLVRLCRVFNCTIDDLIDILPEKVRPGASV